jgi:hypothetical protein
MYLLYITQFKLHEAKFINCEDYSISLEKSGQHSAKKTILVNGIDIYNDALFNIFTNKFAHQCNTLVLNADVEHRLKSRLRILISIGPRPWEKLKNGELHRGTIDFFSGDLVTKPKTVDGYGQPLFFIQYVILVKLETRVIGILTLR